MEYLIRFTQMHETFRQPETEAVAELVGVKFRWVSYSDNSPFAIIAFEDAQDSDAAARKLIARSILGMDVYELWGSGDDYDSLHQDIRQRTEHLWPSHNKTSFRFDFDSFQGSRSNSERRSIIERFSYMNFKGPIVMKKADHEFIIFEDYVLHTSVPYRIHFGRFVAESGRRAINKYTLKKRKYIATTSMDAELSLVTANMVQVAPGKLAYDPFMGTGSFPVSCAHFGATVFGSDLDGRSIRGKKGRNVSSNFVQYDTLSRYLGGFAADITNTPLAGKRYLDAIVCDPPYGVREGLKVLGHVKESLQSEVLLPDGTPAHLRADYIPPKRPYSFLRMIDDVLDFGSTRLVDGGRLAMWMPVAGPMQDAEPDAPQEGAEEEEEEYAIPQHPSLRLVSVCTQDFNKWSRRLLTYERRSDHDVDQVELTAYQLRRTTTMEGGFSGLASDLNDFRKKYFQGFKSPTSPAI